MYWRTERDREAGARSEPLQYLTWKKKKYKSGIAAAAAEKTDDTRTHRTGRICPPPPPPGARGGKGGRGKNPVFVLSLIPGLAAISSESRPRPPHGNGAARTKDAEGRLILLTSPSADPVAELGARSARGA